MTSVTSPGPPPSQGGAAAAVWTSPPPPPAATDTPDAPDAHRTPERGAGPGGGGSDAASGAQAAVPPPLLLHGPSPRGPPPLRGLVHGPFPGPMGEFGPPRGPGPLPVRPPFFIREIYKNGFLKRLPYNEKRSSALAKLMKTDRYWVVFSIHDDLHPFLELWQEPTEVASRPPQYMFPLAACQHISPSIIPADSEWSFVVNFDTVAIRFSCNSREVMEDWVEVIRNKLNEMGILNPKGNLYSKAPLGPPAVKPVVIRDPTSPLPQPPPEGTAAAAAAKEKQPPLVVSLPGATRQQQQQEGDQQQVTSQAGVRHKTSAAAAVTETSAGSQQTFTTSIYLKQTPPQTPQAAAKGGAAGGTTQPSLTAIGRKTSLPIVQTTAAAKATVVSSSSSAATPLLATSQASSPPDPKQADVALSVTGGGSASGGGGGGGGGATSVYLNQASPARHVTVIPVNTDQQGNNNSLKEEAGQPQPASPAKHKPSADLLTKEAAGRQQEAESHTYGAIFDFDEKAVQRAQLDRKRSSDGGSYEQQFVRKKSENISPTRRGRDRGGGRSQQQQPAAAAADEPPPLPHRPVLRRLSERRHELTDAGSSRLLAAAAASSAEKSSSRVRRKSRRSSSLGPLLDANDLAAADIGASTHSLESVDSNPRQAVPKSDRGLGAVPRRTSGLLRTAPQPAGEAHEAPPGSPTHPLLGSPPRNLSDLPPGIRPPPYHPLAALSHPPPASGGGQAFPPMIPLPGLTCQLSIPPGMTLPPPPSAAGGGGGGERDPERSGSQRTSPVEQQVIRLRQEIAHPAGVRLQLRKKDCQGSLALVDIFGCVWVAGWKQKEFPVLFNAFHIGDQILSVGGVLIRSAGDFGKLVKSRAGELHVEIIIRRVPFGQVFHLKRDIEGQSLGIVTNGPTAEVKEIIPGSVAAQAGINGKIRSIDGQTVVPQVMTEINGRPVNLLSKEGEAWERLQVIGSREASVLLQPSDVLAKMRKQLKSVRGYKDYLLA